ncbi:MAG: hypothetical protein HF978_08795 [Desulfobacteraceae bacterium]|nr:hypothetical protein [Desulfobacteraceae bacterium]MBC2755630.1 hypothetical protein [Desulfobacteraceae bacterium]
MFDEVIIDVSTDNKKAYGESFNKKEYRLYPFLYLVAGKIKEAGNYQERVDYRGIDFVERVNHVSEGRPNFMDLTVNNEGILFTPHSGWKAHALKSQGLTSENAALLLAAAGLEITVPSFTFDIARSEEVMIVRNKLAEEREKYLASIITLTDEAYDRIASGLYKDTVDWALNEAFLKIKPKAMKFEVAMSKLDRNILERIRYNFISDGIPAIGSALVDKGFKEAAKVSMVKLLEILSKNLVRSFEERESPEVVYGYKVNQIWQCAKKQR